MAYTPTTWVDDSVPAITAAQLNRMEAGIDAGAFGYGDRDPATEDLDNYDLAAPGAFGAWYDWDLSAIVKNNSSHVQVRMASTVGVVKLRARGNTNAHADFLITDGTMVAVPLDASGVVEVFFSEAAAGEGRFQLYVISWW